MKAIISILAASLAAVVLAVPATADDKYIAGVTDVPSRAHEVANGGLQRYIPGVTDFPSHTPASPTAQAVDTYVTDGFDWIDAGFGAAVGVALGALFGILLLAVRRRGSLTTA